MNIDGRDVSIITAYIFFIMTIFTESMIATAYGSLAVIAAFLGEYTYDQELNITEKQKAHAIISVFTVGIPTSIVFILIPNNILGILATIYVFIVTQITTLSGLDFFDQVKELEPKLEEYKKKAVDYKTMLEMKAGDDSESVSFAEIEGSADYSWKSNDFRMEVEEQ